jgi:hypothetical protein
LGRFGIIRNPGAWLLADGIGSAGYLVFDGGGRWGPVAETVAFGMVLHEGRVGARALSVILSNIRVDQPNSDTLEI